MTEQAVVIDLDAIEVAAKEASPGQWHFHQCEIGVELRDDEGGAIIEDQCFAQDEDMQFIAASNPVVVLELIRRLRAAEALATARIEVIPTDTRVLAIFADIKPEHRADAEEFTNCIQRRTSSWTLVAYFNTDASIEALSVEAMAEAGWVRAPKEDV